jgi:AmmeMemoRadiSam system protein A
VTAWVREHRVPAPPALGDLPRCGVFVSLHRRGDLRGCIGHIIGDAPLADLVGDMAVAAASQDPRFPPVGPDELDGLDVEVSFLSPPVPARADEVVPGEHGVIIRRGGRTGVFLPQVATEQGWDRATLLAMLCRKAGLPGEALRDPATRLEVFRAQVVGGDVP